MLAAQRTFHTSFHTSMPCQASAVPSVRCQASAVLSVPCQASAFLSSVPCQASADPWTCGAGRQEREAGHGVGVPVPRTRHHRPGRFQLRLRVCDHRVACHQGCLPLSARSGAFSRPCIFSVHIFSSLSVVSLLSLPRIMDGGDVSKRSISAARATAWLLILVSSCENAVLDIFCGHVAVLHCAVASHVC